MFHFYHYSDMITTRVREYVALITNNTLDGRVALTVSEYANTDYLLCHDDRMAGRRIAFVLYLSLFCICTAF
jgi:hypothetical protein